MIPPPLTPREYGTWWAQPDAARRRWAYYLCLRHNYSMPAQEAIDYIRRIEADYPNFIITFPHSLTENRS